MPEQPDSTIASTPPRPVAPLNHAAGGEAAAGDPDAGGALPVARRLQYPTTGPAEPDIRFDQERRRRMM